MADVLALFAPFGFDALLGALVLVGVALACYKFADKVFDEWQANNERKAGLAKAQAEHQAELEDRREARKQAEVEERAARDRERGAMEGRIAAQIERSNALMDAMRALMESVVASNEVLHADLTRSQSRSADMAQKVDRMDDRVDMILEKVSR